VNPEHRHLLNGYATGTLTPAERERLFAAALEDQSLFDALAEEQSLKDLLDDPEARGYLLAELDRQKPQATPLVTPPQATRYWLPLTAVMLGLLITGWVWWSNQPVPALEIATRQSPPPAPVNSNSEVRVSPAAQRVTALPPAIPAENRPAPPPVLDSISKKEVDAAPAPPNARAMAKAVPKTASADAAPPPAPLPALAAGNLAVASPPTYQLLRVENGQFLPTNPSARFAAGDVVALQVPFQSDPPQVTFANQPPLTLTLTLTRAGDWYRTETVTLASGQQDFVVTPGVASPARSRLAAPAEAEAKATTGPWDAYVIRIRVP